VGCSSGTCSVCKPGYYPSASSPTGCAECGLGFYCPNGKDRNPCGGSETTTTTTATSDSECVAKCTTDAGEGVQEESAQYPVHVQHWMCGWMDTKHVGSGSSTVQWVDQGTIQASVPRPLNARPPPPDCPTGVACSSGTCSACKPGYYPSAAAASGCAECGFGFYCPNGEDRKPCGTGQTTSTTTSTDKSECVPGCKTDAGELLTSSCRAAANPPQADRLAAELAVHILCPLPVLRPKL
jgi:hypothetical protein